ADGVLVLAGELDRRSLHVLLRGGAPFGPRRRSPARGRPRVAARGGAGGRGGGRRLSHEGPRGSGAPGSDPSSLLSRDPEMDAADPRPAAFAGADRLRRALRAMVFPHRPPPSRLPGVLLRPRAPRPLHD